MFKLTRTKQHIFKYVQARVSTLSYHFRFHLNDKQLDLYFCYFSSVYQKKSRIQVRSQTQTP